MSGGSYHYAYRHVEDFADSLSGLDSPARLAFRDLLRRVAKAMHAIEWVDSCDYGKGDEVPAIMACLSEAGIHREVVERLRAALAAHDQARGPTVPTRTASGYRNQAAPDE